MARFKTFANSGTLAPGDLEIMKTEIDDAISRRKKIWIGQMSTWYNPGNSWLLPTKIVALSSQSQVPGFRETDGTWSFGSSGGRGHLIAIDNQSTAFRKQRIMYEVVVNLGLDPNGTPYGANVALALYPVVGQGHVQNLGQGFVTWVAGSVPMPGTGFSIGNPVSGSMMRLFSSSFPVPQNGNYLLCASVDATPPVGSDLGIMASVCTLPGDRS